MGRVMTLRHGAGLGGELLRRGIREIREKMNPKRILIEAQVYAAGFYSREGYRACSDEFLEDGIPHVQMVLECPACQADPRERLGQAGRRDHDPGGRETDMTIKERAVRYYKEGYLCSQAILAACAERYGLPEGQALKLGTCLGMGMREGEVCGACTGALMVLGLAHDDPLNRKAAYENGERFLDAFRKINGSCRCNDLLGCDVRTPEGIRYARDNHLFTEFCPRMVACAAEILEEILAQDEGGKTL